MTSRISWPRLAGRIAATLAVVFSCAIGAAATAAAAVHPDAAAGRPTLTAAGQRQLLGLYAAYRHIPRSDIARVRPGTLVTRTATGVEWALAGFVVSPQAPQSVAVSFQDGASFGVFTRRPGQSWRVSELGRAPLGCEAGIPASVLRSWGYGSCPTAAAGKLGPAVVRPQTSGVGSSIASIAEKYAGVVQDNPPQPQPVYQADDCNPFTAYENASAPSAGCLEDPTLHVQDRSEFWCSDFAKWVWSQAGVSGPLSDLTPGAGSFYAYGAAEHDSMSLDPPASSAAVGDAVVLYPAGTTITEIEGASPYQYADHVGIVTGVNTSAGTIDTVNGDFGYGSPSEVGVWDVGYRTPSSFASGFEASGEEWLFVAPAGSATPPPSVPSVAISSSGQASVFWKGLGTELEEAAGDANPDDGTLNGTDLGMGGLGSMPTAGDDSQGYSYVYWEGTNSDLWEAYYNGSSWEGPHDTGVAMGTTAQPAVAISHSPKSTAQAYIFWRGANGNLMEAQGYANPAYGSLSGPYDRGYGVLGSSPTAGVDGSGHTYVYWEGTNGALYEGYYNGAGWVSDAVNHGYATMGSAPAVAITDSPSATAQAYVFWKGTNGNLIEVQGDADPDDGALSGIYDRGYGVLGSAPTAGVDGSGRTYVFWEGGNGNLYEGYYNGAGWVSDAVDLGFGYM